MKIGNIRNYHGVADETVLVVYGHVLYAVIFPVFFKIIVALVVKDLLLVDAQIAPGLKFLKFRKQTVRRLV